MVFFLTNGLMAGILLAALLALGDALFYTRTFQVLIDVSYIPGLPLLPSLVELIIHLIISVVLAGFLISFYPKTGRGAAKYLAIWSGVLCLIYFPFSWLSGQLLSFTGFVIWAIGHLLYVGFLAYRIRQLR